MKNIKLPLFLLFGFLTTSLFISAQIRVIDNKGTVSIIDASNWKRIGTSNDIYAKLPGNIGIGGMKVPVATLHNAGSTILGMTSVSDVSATYTLPAAFVDDYSGVVITQTTVASSITLSEPTNTTVGRLFTISNASASVYTLTVAGSALNITPGESACFVWNGFAWSAPSASISNVLTGVSNKLTSNVNGITSDLAPADGIITNTLGFDSSGKLVIQSPKTTDTSVSNTSTGNGLTTTVNGVTGVSVNLINTNSLTATNGNLVSTVNGIATNPAVPVLISANNGLTATNGNIALGGALVSATTIATDATKTLTLAGLQTGAVTDNIVVANAGVLKIITPTDLSIAGDVSGTLGASSVDKLKGKALSIGTLASGDQLKYNGTNWVNFTPDYFVNLTGMVTSIGNATTVVTNANLTGEVTSVGNATTVTNPAVIGKVLTGYVKSGGTISATDNILQAIQKLDGNITAGSGVSSIMGTANQITASPSTGAVTLSLPATISGLTSVTSTSFTGALTGNASGTSANVTGIVAAANGGTGVTTVAAEQTRLGLGTMAYAATGSYALTNGTNASGTWPISITGNAATATTATNWSGSGALNSYLPLTGGTLSGNLTVNGDIYAIRSGGTAGAILFGNNSGTRYLYYDGAQYVFGGAGLNVGGSVTASSFTGAGTGLTGTAGSLNIGGNAATATTATNWSGSGALGSYLPLAGGTMTGQLNSQGNQGSGIGTGTGGLGAIMVQGNGTNAAFMAFHRPGSYAAYFGLDTDNQWKVGGWSAGAVAYVLLHAGNYNSYSPTLTGGNASGTWGINITGTWQGLNPSQLFNNTGANHGTYTSFSGPTNFGKYFIHQDAGVTDGPGPTGQFYSESVGLGNDYAYSQYAMQTAIQRDLTNPYMWIRYKGSSSWGGWTKLAAGYADNAGTANAVTWANVSGKPSLDFATHRGEGTNYIDYSRYVYNNGAYSGSGWTEPSDLGVRYASTAGSSTQFMSTSHAGSYYLVNNWDGTYWSITSNHGAPARVGYADVAGTATNSTNSTNATYGRYAYNNGAYSGSGWVEPSDLGVRYANSAGSAGSAGSAASLTGQAVVNGSDGWFRSSGTCGWYSTTYAVGIYATEAGNVRTYNGANFISSGSITATGDVTAFSDIRLKKNIRTLSPVSASLREINAVEFDRKDIKAHQIGFIAQNVQKYFPDLINTANDSISTLSMNYQAMTAPLLKGWQEHDAIIIKQQGEIEGLKDEIGLLKESIEELKKAIADKK